jgi:hypothetical protein
MASNRLNLVDGSCQNGSSPTEKAARATLNLHYGRAITDAEWASARAGLLEFVAVLRSWDLPIRAGESDVGNVTPIRQSRP